MASLYTQVEYLKTQISEKDLLIRTLLINEQEYYTYNIDKEGEIINERNEENCELSDVSLSENSESLSSLRIRIKENDGTEPNSDDNGDKIYLKIYMSSKKWAKRKI